MGRHSQWAARRPTIHNGRSGFDRVLQTFDALRRYENGVRATPASTVPTRGIVEYHALKKDDVILSYWRKAIAEIPWRMFFDYHDVDGISVGVHDEAADDCLTKVQSALALIQEIDPRTYALIPKLLTGGIVIVEPASSQAWYDPKRKACCLTFDYVSSAKREDIALCIVHELCHARLFAAGIGYEEARRLRVEKVCVRRELAFAKRLTQHQVYTDQAEKHLSTLTADYYTDEQFRWRARQDTLRRLRKLKALKVPRPVRRFTVLRVRRRWQKENAKQRNSPEPGCP